MKITLDRREFAETLKWVASALDKRATGGACGVRVTVADGSLRLGAWDYVAAHAAALPALGAEPGEVLVPGVAFASLVGAMRANDITLAEDDGALSIISGASSYRLRLLPLDDYAAPPVPPRQIGTTSGQALSEAVAATEWAAARDAMLVNHHQIRLTAADGLLTLAATNRFVLATDACAYEGEVFEAGIQPPMLASAVAGLATEQVVGIGLDGSLLSLIGETRTVSLRLVNERFVANWRGLFDKARANPGLARVDAADLASAAKRVAALADDVQSPVDITYDPSGGITLSAYGAVGEGRDEVAGEASIAASGCFSAQYLAGALRIFSGEVEIAYPTGYGATLVSSTTTPNRLALAMPRRRTA